MKKMQQYLFNGIVLTATSLLVSWLGVWFNLTISHQIGNEKMGVYQLILSVYAFAVTMASGGIPFAVTRLVAEKSGAQKDGQIRHVMRKSVLYALCFGCGTCVGLFFAAPWIGRVCLQDTQTILPLQIMALSLPFLCLGSVWTGYFQAVRHIAKPSAVHIAEQLLHMGLTMLGLRLLPATSLTFTCSILAVSALLTQMFACFCSLKIYRSHTRLHLPPKEPAEAGIGKRLVSVALPLAVSTNLRSGLLAVKNLLVPIRLQLNGLTKSQALAGFGLIHGVVLPVLLFCNALLSSFANLLIPELTECQVQSQSLRDNPKLHYILYRASQMTLLFAIGVSGVFLFCADPFSQLFARGDTAAFYLKALAPLIPVMYLDHVVDCMLKGLNQQLSSMRYNLLDTACSLCFVWFLLPSTGLAGYLFIIYGSEVLNTALSIHRLLKITSFPFPLWRAVCKPVFCLTVSFFASGLLGDLLSIPWQTPLLQVLFEGSCLVLFYLVLLRLTRTVSDDDLQWFTHLFSRPGRRSPQPLGA